MSLEGVLTKTDEEPEEAALRMMYISAKKGWPQARTYLNKYCEEQYQKRFYGLSEGAADGRLVGFDGKPIKINRTGILTPVDAVLEYKDGKNTIKLSTNLRICFGDEISGFDSFEQAVIDGLKAWEGEYEVFGGQKVFVQVDVTREDRLFDNLWVFPVTDSVEESIRYGCSMISNEAKQEQIENLMDSKRSFASHGVRWSASSRKVIFIQSEDGKFNDYDDISDIAKHEFGHTLGLGDLYASAGDSLGGIHKGTYEELDSYAITDKLYNLVMCDHEGPVSNNDIEMVILAFSDNEMQLYQSGKIKGKISAALGKGN